MHKVIMVERPEGMSYDDAMEAVGRFANKQSHPAKILNMSELASSKKLMLEVLDESHETRYWVLKNSLIPDWFEDFADFTTWDLGEGSFGELHEGVTQFEWLSGIYMPMAYRAALSSGDPSTQNGSILVSGIEGISVIGMSSNYLPGNLDRPSIWNDRQAKYDAVIHAERGSIYDAARKGYVTEGSTMYALWASCLECAKGIVGAGVKTLVTHQFYIGDGENERWDDSIAKAMQYLADNGVEIKLTNVKCSKDGQSLLYSGTPVCY